MVIGIRVQNNVSVAGEFGKTCNSASDYLGPARKMSLPIETKVNRFVRECRSMNVEKEEIIAKDELHLLQKREMAKAQYQRAIDAIDEEAKLAKEYMKAIEHVALLQEKLFGQRAQRLVSSTAVGGGNSSSSGNMVTCVKDEVSSDQSCSGHDPSIGNIGIAQGSGKSLSGSGDLSIPSGSGCGQGWSGSDLGPKPSDRVSHDSGEEGVDMDVNDELLNSDSEGEGMHALFGE